jgi:hypothetical protein
MNKLFFFFLNGNLARTMSTPAGSACPVRPCFRDRATRFKVVWLVLHPAGWARTRFVGARCQTRRTSGTATAAPTRQRHRLGWATGNREYLKTETGGAVARGGLLLPVGNAVRPSNSRVTTHDWRPARPAMQRARPYALTRRVDPRLAACVAAPAAISRHWPGRLFFFYYSLRSQFLSLARIPRLLFC